VNDVADVIITHGVPAYTAGQALAEFILSGVLLASAQVRSEGDLVRPSPGLLLQQ
jgi:hypothetical protein